MEESRKDVYGFLRISMKKKIVILSAFLTPFRSGAEACAEEVPLVLADRYDFTIVTARMRKNLPKYDHLQGEIPVIRVGFGCTFDKWLYPFLAPFAVRKVKPDIVHAVLETFAGLALAWCRASRKILTCQTTNRTFLKRFIVRRADTVTAISSALIAIVQPHRKDVVIKIPNGIHNAVFAEAKETHTKVPGRVLFVGRLEQQKGVDTLLEAFAQVDAAAHLRIVGDGSRKKMLMQLAKDVQIEDRVTFVGRVRPEQIATEYAQAEIFCGLSRSEALGNVFLEAQAAGCYVIHTNVGGITDIVDDSAGCGIEVNDNMVAQTAQAMDAALKDDALRTRASESGIRRAAQYDWKDIAEQYAKLY